MRLRSYSDTDREVLWSWVDTLTKAEDEVSLMSVSTLDSSVEGMFVNLWDAFRCGAPFGLGCGRAGNCTRPPGRNRGTSRDATPAAREASRRLMEECFRSHDNSRRGIPLADLDMSEDSFVC